MTKPQVTTQIPHPRVRGVWHAGVDMSSFVHPGGKMPPPIPGPEPESGGEGGEVA